MLYYCGIIALYAVWEYVEYDFYAYYNDQEILQIFDFEDENNWNIYFNGALDTHITLFTTAEIIETLENEIDEVRNILKLQISEWIRIYLTWV